MSRLRLLASLLVMAAFSTQAVPVVAASFPQKSTTGLSPAGQGPVVHEITLWENLGEIADHLLDYPPIEHVVDLCGHMKTLLVKRKAKTWNAEAGEALVLVAKLRQLRTWIPINVWSDDPNTRMEQLMYSEFGPRHLRDIEDEWRKFWFTDQPSHMTPIRVHGGVGP
jgi:hypothetical protein